MNTQSNAAPETVATQRVAPAAISAIQPFYWSLWREFWENRWIYIAPLGVGVLFLLGFLIRIIHLQTPVVVPGWVHDPKSHRTALALPYDILAGLMMVVAFIIAVFYSLDALYGERRDRSILFWKSLPVSDLTTVLAKATIPIVFLPLFSAAITIATQLIMVLLSGAVLAAKGQSVAMLWHELSFPRMSLLLLYHLVTMHALWIAPVYAWFLLVSAWARRAPFLWAFLLPIALCYLEKLTFNTTYLTTLLFHRLSGTGMEALPVSGTFPTDPVTQLTPGRFLASPGLWIGLAITAVFLAAAVRLRRQSGPN